MPREVLIIEDDPDVLSMLKTSFETGGFAALTASSGAEAKKVIAAHKSPGKLLLIVDVALRGENGIGLGVSIYKQLPTIRILFISGYIDELLIVNSGLPKEHADFLRKPFTQAELISAVNRLVA